MKIFMTYGKKQILASLLAVLVFTVVFATALDGAAAAADTAQRKLPIYAVGREESDKIISISFDAAWGNEDTQTLIDILGKYNVKATFFVVGQWVDKYPESVLALHDAGHEIMNHSNTHPHMAKLSAEQQAAEIESCNEKIQTLTGIRPALLRAPYGEYNDTLIETLKDLNMYCIQWDVDSLDWKNPTPEQICERVCGNVRPGSIVLFHNAAVNTPAALPQIIENLLAQGYTFVPISRNICCGECIIDHEGRQWQISGSENDAAAAK